LTFPHRRSRLRHCIPNPLCALANLPLRVALRKELEAKMAVSKVVVCDGRVEHTASQKLN
jgi:hypothetical protein